MGPGAPTRILATVNQTPVTVDDWRTAAGASALVAGTAPNYSARAESAAVPVLVQQTVVRQWAEANRVISPAAARRQALEYMRTRLAPRYGGWGGLSRQLAKDHLDQAALVRYLTREAILRAAYRRVTQNTPAPTARQVLGFYESHRTRFTTPRTVLERQLPVPTMAAAHAALGALQHGARFSAVARRYGSGKTVGKVGWRIASGPSRGLRIVKWPRGYAIVAIEAVKPGQVAPFSAVRPVVADELAAASRQTRFEMWVRRLDKSAHIKIYRFG